MNKFLAKLIGWREQREDFSQTKFNAESTQESQLAAERQKARQKEMRDGGWREVPLPTEPAKNPDKNQE